MVAMKLLGDAPEEVVCWACSPSTKDWSAELTPPVARALEKLPALVLEQIAAWKDASKAKETSYEC